MACWGVLNRSVSSSSAVFFVTTTIFSNSGIRLFLLRRSDGRRIQKRSQKLRRNCKVAYTFCIFSQALHSKGQDCLRRESPVGAQLHLGCPRTIRRFLLQRLSPKIGLTLSVFTFQVD